MSKDKNGNQKPLYLKNATDTKIRRHIKIKSDANPFNPLYKDYFTQREQQRVLRGLSPSNGGWLLDYSLGYIWPLPNFLPYLEDKYIDRALHG